MAAGNTPHRRTRGSVESNDELQDPLFRYLEREVIPLATNEQLKELYQTFIGS